MRATRSSSSIWSSTACWRGWLRSVSMASRPSACLTVRGKPSRMKLREGEWLARLARLWEVNKTSNVPALALGIVVKLLLDHADDDVIADEAALVHDLLGFSAEGGLLRDLAAEHVTRGLRGW